MLSLVLILFPGALSANTNHVVERDFPVSQTAADEICAGNYRLFGGNSIALELQPAVNPVHWTEYERGISSWGDKDIKLIWEPARLGWAIELARIYSLTNDQKYVQAYWANIEKFLAANPPYLGPNWMSAQEAAIRIIALSFSLPLVWSSPESTLARKKRILESLAAHAQRIEPTLAYARAQNNNHLLFEGIGLFTVGNFLRDIQKAITGWKKAGGLSIGVFSIKLTLLENIASTA